jgi:hypothetical protein
VERRGPKISSNVQIGSAEMIYKAHNRKFSQRKMKPTVTSRFEGLCG